MDILCNKHNLLCWIKERVQDYDAYIYQCSEGCEFRVTGQQIHRAEQLQAERDSPEPK